MRTFVAVVLLLLGASTATLPAQTEQGSAIFAVVMTRHGVRSFTKPPAAYTWLDWSPVAPGFLTAHGYKLMTFLGKYYRDYFASIGLSINCASHGMYVYADVDQRTLETGRALIEGACGSPDAVPLYHDAAIGPGVSDPLFDGSDWLIPAGKVDTAASIASVTAAAPKPPSLVVTQNAAAFAALQYLLDAQCSGTCPRADAGPSEITAKPGGLAAMRGPLAVGEGYVESMFLERAQCAPLSEAFRFHQTEWLRTTEYQINARNAYNASVKGGNVFAHIVGLLQAKAGMPHPDVSVPDVSQANVVMISGHDTQIGALGGILGTPMNGAPPGGALVFELYRRASGEYHVRVQFVHETWPQLESNSPVQNGVMNEYDDGDYDLATLSALAHGFAQRGFVLHDWTAQSDAPVTLAPLADPKWTSCNP
jgi:4-phytase / acid phosphatase